MIDENLAPIVLFVYNRPKHTLETLNALRENHLSTSSKLYIISDGLQSNATKENENAIKKVHEIIMKEQWCGEVEIRISKVNNGCRKTIKSGVSEIVNKYGSVIIVEDDIVTSPCFLTYMNDALVTYENNQRIMMVGGYTPPISISVQNDFFFLQYASPWGWATWANSWNEYSMSNEMLLGNIKKNGQKYKFDFNDSQGFFNMIEESLNGKIDQWGVSWYATLMINNGLGVYPKKSLVRNIGFDGTGIHCGNGYWYDIKKLHNKKVNFEDIEIKELPWVRDLYVDFYKSTNKVRLKDKIKFKYELEKKKIKSLFINKNK